MTLDLEAIEKRRVDWLENGGIAEDAQEYASDAAADVLALLAEVRRLRAEVEWRPIDHAAKRGQWVMGWGHYIGSEDPSWTKMQWDDDNREWCDEWGDRCIPTHFRLINPPQEPGHD